MHALPETLTLAQANAAVAAIQRQVENDGAEDGVVTIDASGVRNFDTSAIAVLLEARRLAAAGGRALSVQGAPAAMVELSGLYGVKGLLGFAGAEVPDQSARA